MDDVNTENKTTDNIKVEKETKENANAENRVAEGANAENRVAEGANAENRVAEGANAENRIAEGANAENRIAEAPDAESRVADAPDAENEVTQEPKSENEVTQEPKSENKVTQEPKSENKVTQEPKSENKVMQEPNSENRITEHNAENGVMKESQNAMEENANVQNNIEEEQNAENEVRENAIVADEDIVVLCCPSVLEKNNLLFRQSNHFALEVTRYMRRCYDISKTGSSDIKDEEVDLPRIVKIMLERSTSNYSRTKHLGKYLPIGSPENRHKVLKTAFYEEMIYSCNNEHHTRIIILCALCFLAAFDLQETLGFEDAVNCATSSLAKALFRSDSYWIDSDDHDSSDILFNSTS